jgi:hypothetical protein
VDKDTGALDDIPNIVGDMRDNRAKEDKGEVDGSGVRSGGTGGGGKDMESVDRYESGFRVYETTHTIHDHLLNPTSGLSKHVALNSLSGRHSGSSGACSGESGGLSLGVAGHYFILVIFGGGISGAGDCWRHNDEWMSSRLFMLGVVHLHPTQPARIWARFFVQPTGPNPPFPDDELHSRLHPQKPGACRIFDS